MSEIAPTAVRIRNKGIKIRPIRVSPAYEDPEFLLDAVRRTAPHRNFFEVEGYDQGRAAPVFRAYWIDKADAPLASELRPILYNPIFIEATQKTYNAKVVRPLRVIVNLNVPGPAHEVHMDYPSFRGIHSHPTWVNTLMGLSGLFEKWEVQVSSGLAWFYNGENGGFRYWPNGADRPAMLEQGPFWNRGLICDNEYTFHQVCSVGRPDQYMPECFAGRDCSLHWDEAGRWCVVYRNRTVISYPFEQVRLMTLWKARVFEDERAAAIYDEHADDLTYDEVFRIFADDLRERCYQFQAPHDPLNDPQWRKLLREAYPPASPPVDSAAPPA